MSLTRLAFLNVWRREALCIYLLPGAISVASSIVRPARWPPWQAPTSDESASNGMPREMSARRADYVAWTESAASRAVVSDDVKRMYQDVSRWRSFDFLRRRFPALLACFRFFLFSVFDEVT